MLHINKDRHQVLLKRLEEFRTARRKLVQQLEELDTQARAMQRYFNAVAPVGCLPEEVLAMVFEAGTHLKYELGLHFAVLVSHVTHSWRNIALATPRLWATIQCAKAENMELTPYPETAIERTAAFLTRSRPLPVDIHIKHFFDEDLLFLQLIRDHFGRCQHLSVTDAGDLPKALTYFSRQSAPHLESFKLVLEDELDEPILFEEPLFPSGAPRLKTAQIHGIELCTLPFCLAALQSITSLSLSYLYPYENDGADDGYTALRNSLMALPSLIHLELLDNHGFHDKPSRRPIVLHTLQSLRGQTSEMGFLSLIHAASLTVLILEFTSSRARPLRFDFPLLQHLVLLNVTRMIGFLSHFPGIERLTLQIATAQLDVNNILPLGPRIVLASCGPHAHAAGTCLPITHLRLRTLALSPSYDRPPDIARLTSHISNLKGAGIPFGKIMLPENLLSQEGADLEAFAELRKVVEIVDFRVDWPTPFSSERFAEV